MAWLFEGSSRRSQRAALLILVGAGGVASIQSLLLPPPPPLPRLSGTTLPAGGWQPRQLASPPAAVGVWALQRHAATGPGLAFQRRGQLWLLLTPLASWSAAGFDPAVITRAIPQLHLRNARLLTFRSQEGPLASYQVALGNLGDHQTVRQSCLTAQPGLAYSNTVLRSAPAPREPRVVARLGKALRRLLPWEGQPHACVLITTNDASLLDGSPASRRLWARWASRTQWPGRTDSPPAAD